MSAVESGGAGRGRVLIVGSGYAGGRLAARLAGAGRTVITLRRNPPSATADGVETLRCDLDDPDDRRALADRLAAAGTPLRVAYLVPPARIPADANPGESSDSRLAGFLDSMRDIDVTRLVLASTSGVYGDRGGAPVSEDTPVRPQSDRARARVAAEATAMRYAASRATSLCILRIAGIYGPGRLPLEQIRASRPIIHPDESGPGNRIHVDDLVTSLAMALDAQRPPAVVNVCDGNHLSSSAFCLAVAAAAGLPAPPLVTRAEAQRTFGDARLSFVNESRTLDATRLIRELGVRLRYPDPLEGIRASLGTGDGQG